MTGKGAGICSTPVGNVMQMKTNGFDMPFVCHNSRTNVIKATFVKNNGSHSSNTSFQSTAADKNGINLFVINGVNRRSVRVKG